MRTVCFVDLHKAFDIVQRKLLECAMWKKGIPEALARSVMSLYEGRVIFCSELPENFNIKITMHQR